MARVIFFQKTGHYPDPKKLKHPESHEWGVKVSVLWPGFASDHAKTKSLFSEVTK